MSSDIYGSHEIIDDNNESVNDIHEILKDQLDKDIHETANNMIEEINFVNEYTEDIIEDDYDEFGNVITTFIDNEQNSFNINENIIENNETTDVTTILGHGKSKSNYLKNPPIRGTGKVSMVETDFPMENGDIDKNLITDDIVTICDAEMNKNGFSGDHIKSMNSFMTKGLEDIITKQFRAEVQNYKYSRDKTEEDKSISHCGFSISFTKVNLKPPVTTKYKSAQVQILTPNMARLQDLTYSASLEVSAKITILAIKHNGDKITREDEVKDFRISSIPVMLKTDICTTHGMVRETLKHIGEDPNDIGGYFIVGGTEWVVDSLENIANNKFHVYKKAYQDEIARGNIISKPGDGYENSRQIIIRYLVTGAITVEMTTGKLSKIQLPFYLLFRILGINSDKDIVNHIAYGIDNTDIVSKEIYKILEKAFIVDDNTFSDLKTEINISKITERIAHRILDDIANQNYKNNENSLRYFHNKMLSMIDENLLPHMGLSPASRPRKIKYLGHLINTLLKVSLGILESTDRDSYANKRLAAAGVSLSKAFKTHFNIVVIQELKNAFINALASTQFKLINIADVFKSAIKTQELERLLIQSITSGNKTITVKRNEIMNRVSSQQLEHKNDLNKKSQLNSIVTPSSSTNKQNERADVMRRVHPTYLGYICTSQSADSGPKVGVNKQKAISGSICDASNSAILKIELMNEPTMIPLDKVLPTDVRDKELAKVFVNGDWIGCVVYAHDLARLYRLKRRFGNNVHHLTSIVWEPLVREIHFWTDVGRLARPLVIVYNNIHEYDQWCMGGKKGTPKKFKQWIKLTKDHIRQLQQKKITIDDLREQRIIEYITTDESLNCFIARDLDVLKENEFDITKPFTHMDIQQCIFGLAALTSPFTNHSSGVRVTYHTNQKKQTAGWFALNWAYMMHKAVFLQYYCDYPLVRTYADKLTNPNGQNVMIALMCYSGFNQEDSAIINKTSVERGLYQGSKFDVERTELEQGEQFGNPDFTKTLDIKKNAIYDYIVDGFIKKGTIVYKNYVLIVKTARIPKPTNEYLYIDKSIIYKNDEPAIVEDVILPRSEDGVLSVKIKLRMNRPIRKGDKCCLTADHEVMTKHGWVSIDKLDHTDDVMTLNPNGHLEYQTPTEFFRYQVEETELVSLSTPYVNFKATKNHRMYVRDNKTGVFELKPISDIMENISNDIIKENTNKVINKNIMKTTMDKNQYQNKIPTDKNQNQNKTPTTAQSLLLQHTKGSKVKIRGVNDVNDDNINGNEIKTTLPPTVIKRTFEYKNCSLGISDGMGMNNFLPYVNDYINQLIKAININCEIVLELVKIYKLQKNQATYLREEIRRVSHMLNGTTGDVILKTKNKILYDTCLQICLHSDCNAKLITSEQIVDDYIITMTTAHALTFKANYVVEKSNNSVNELNNSNIGSNNSVNEPNIEVKESNTENIKNNNIAVYCFTVPNHIFMVRRNGKLMWTGNSSRTGNKGIIGKELDQADMPYDENGEVPDIIVNPHSIPSRMAIGQLFESVVGTLGLEIGKIFDATCFKKVNIYELIDRLEELGIKYGGKRRLYNGQTGNWIDTHILLCVNTYQRLLKFIDDDSYYVSRGPTNALTHQPVDGRVNKGGLRLGEMEEWVIAAHGSMRALSRKLYKDSDEHVIPICRRCGNKAITNVAKGIYACKYCSDKADIANVPSSWMMNIFTHMLASMGVKTDFEVEPYTYSRNEE